MADILPFKKLKPAGKGITLCASNHHKWVIDTARIFDVKQGRLVTVYICKRCGKKKVRSH